MNRVLYILVAILAAVLVAAPVAGAGKHKPKTKKFSVYAMVDSAAIDDRDPQGDSQGDMITFTQKLFTDSSMTTQIGSDEVFCVRTIVGASRVCTGIFSLKGGEIMITGRESLAKHSLAITGGTGKYRNARGEIVLEPVSVVADQMSFKITLRP